ncbi:DUF1446 domain-containing protein [Lacihabitans sp. LS3-19]|uniref:acyclic terpene utilization AtuA family protein n=1 Tax=Lacihabitans sp. LS3-19 TaxID=2487335 RepID=UPI0020CBEF4D|nr:acyclic terpene utilization AtuA family protein [Lacihabitans sp. LS3-19]MCP9770443.1 DUF1446 domain-containing protein [Lacihabitans sp. LS3-19]
MKQKIRIGCGAGFSGDRLEPALILAEKGELDYLVLECLAERTIGLAQKRKMANPELGYDPLLERRITSLLPILVKNKVKLISNMGAANPLAAIHKIQEIALKLDLRIKIAAVTGDDVFSKIDKKSEALENGIRLENNGDLLAANAYLGVEGILEGLKSEAQIIITGRVADPSLFLAPMIHELGWNIEDFELLGKGTVIGHLMECAGQITGGYFADPIKKPVNKMEILGHPIATVSIDGSAIISKVNGTGGIINLQTIKEQLLYEVINPHAYYTPDVSADFTNVYLEDLGENQVKINGGGGSQKPTNLKVSVAYKAFFLGEGEISYAGTGALERSKLAGEIIEKRLKGIVDEIRIDYLGINSMHNGQFKNESVPYEIRLRIAAKAKSKADAERVGEEVEALYTNGPAGGGGVRKYVNEVVGIVSTMIDRNKIELKITTLNA